MVHVADAVASGLVEAASSIHVNIDVNDNYIANYLYVTTWHTISTECIYSMAKDKLTS